MYGNDPCDFESTDTEEMTAEIGAYLLADRIGLVLPTGAREFYLDQYRYSGDEEQAKKWAVKVVEYILEKANLPLCSAPSPECQSAPESPAAVQNAPSQPPTSTPLAPSPTLWSRALAWLFRLGKHMQDFRGMHTAPHR